MTYPHPHPLQSCPDTTCDCYYGTDAVNFTRLPGIDFSAWAPRTTFRTL